MHGTRTTAGTRMRLRAIRARLSIPTLLAGADEETVVSIVAGVNGGLALLLIGLFAWLTGLPLVFPALGPTAFVLYSAPFSAAAAPRSVIVGHLMAIGLGWCMWAALSSVTGNPISLATGGWPVFAASTLALATTSLALIHFRCPHPPACASALIVAFGGVSGLGDLLAMAAAVVLLTAQALAVNKLAGVRVPLWRPRTEPADGDAFNGPI